MRIVEYWIGGCRLFGAGFEVFCLSSPLAFWCTNWINSTSRLKNSLIQSFDRWLFVTWETVLGCISYFWILLDIGRLHKLGSHESCSCKGCKGASLCDILQSALSLAVFLPGFREGIWGFYLLLGLFSSIDLIWRTDLPELGSCWLKGEEESEEDTLNLVIAMIVRIWDFRRGT